MADLTRRLGTTDAVVIGLSSMIDAGLFGAFGPAVAAAGPGMLAGLAVAALLAFCNASSSAALAARYPSAGGVLQSAGLLFFAFAGYARIATLGEEVREPERTVPRAVPTALGLVVVLCAVVGGTLLAGLGPSGLATAAAPLADAVRGGTLAGFAPVAVAGAGVAVVVLSDLRSAIGFSSFGVLVYYAITNASAFTLPSVF